MLRTIFVCALAIATSSSVGVATAEGDQCTNSGVMVVVGNYECHAQICENHSGAGAGAGAGGTGQQDAGAAATAGFECSNDGSIEEPPCGKPPCPMPDTSDATGVIGKGACKTQAMGPVTCR